MPKKKQIAVRLLMLYFGRYLAAERGRKAEFRRYYFKRTGEKMHQGVLWKHTSLNKEPAGSTLLVYLNYLHEQKAIAPAKSGLFRYTLPQLLKK